MTCPNFPREILSANDHNLVGPYHSRYPNFRSRILRLSLSFIFCAILLCATTATSQVITVTPPQQNRQTLNVGANVVFTVGAASQSGAVEYHWQYSKASATFANLQDGDFNGRVSGSHAASLQISNAQLDDTARFRCLVTDPAMGPGGPATNSGPGFLTVTTNLPFQITTPTGPPQPLSQNQNITLQVKITGQSGTLTGVWQFLSDTLRGTFVSLKDGLQNSGSTVTGSTETMLQISNMQPGDTGKYRYVVADTVGTQVSSYNSGPIHMTVTPNVVPGFSIEPLAPSSGTLTQGGSTTATITVDATNGFSDTVNLAVSGLPSGVTASLAQSSLSVPGSNSTTLTLTASGTANTGPAMITITGTDAPGVLQDTATYSLTVNASQSNPVGVTMAGPYDATAYYGNPNQSDTVDSVILKVQVTGPGYSYVWSRLVNGQTQTLQDNSQCTVASGTTITAPPATAIFCGSSTAILTIFNPQQNKDEGPYTVTVQDSSKNPVYVGSAKVVFKARGSAVDPGNPEPQLEFLYALIRNQQAPAEEFQQMITWDAINNPWSNGENKAVVAAVVGLFYGPRFIVQNKYTGSVPKMVDYRCWLQDYLGQQIGAGGPSTLKSRYFRHQEFGSFNYSGYVDTAIAAVLLYTNPNSSASQAALDSQSVAPPSCFDPGTLQNYAQTYLQISVAIYGLMAADPPQGLAKFIGVTGPTYREEVSANPPVYKILNNQRLPAPYTNQFMSPVFSVDRSAHHLLSPAIALAGQRTEPGYWPADFRVPILCLALGYTTCDLTALMQQPGMYELLIQDPKQNTPGPLNNYLKNLFSNNSGVETSLNRIISDQGTTADLSNVQNLLASVEVIQNVYLLAWPGVRASCMDWDNTNNNRGFVAGVVYSSAGHFFSAGPEMDFLYSINNGKITDGFSYCSISPSVLNALSQPNGNPAGPSISLPNQTPPPTFYCVLSNSQGLHCPRSRTATVIASPAGAVYNTAQTVTLSSATPGSTIYYTIDGSIPDATSTVYTGPISFSTSSTIDAIASSPGLDDSTRVSNTYFLKTAAATFSLAAGTYTGNQSVTLNDATSGATIYYTTDGSIPTTSSPVYSAPVIVTGVMTINAFATAPGFYNSDVASAAYVINQPLATVSSISPASGSIGGGTTVTIAGTNFRTGATVSLSGYGASSVNVVSSTQLMAVTPAHSAGTVSVVVTNTDSQGGTLANSFSYFTPVNNISWVKPSGVSFGPANTLTVDGSALNGPSPVQTVWRDVTLNGSWNTIAAQSTPDGGGSWANTIPTSNYCHSYDVYANYLNVASPTFHYVGIGSSYCSENAYVNWIEPPSLAGFGPAGSLVVQGNATGAPSGTTVAFYWSDLTTGSGWTQAASANPDSSGTWYNYIPNVVYWHQYNVYVTYDAFDTRNGQGVCTYSANGGTTWCPR